MTQSKRRFEDDELRARRLTTRLYQRARSNPRLSLTWDDIYSEVCMTWVLCCNTFNPEFGVQFATYFTNAVMNNFSGLVKKRVQTVEHTALSMDTGGQSFDDDEDGSLHESWASVSDKTDIEAIVSQRQRLEKLATRLPLLARMLELVADPPEELQEEILALKDYFARAKEVGCETEQAPTGLTLEMLNRMFGFNWRQILVLHKEIERAVDYIS